jgi:hypothetical protein
MLAVATGATVMFTGQSFAASISDTAPRQLTAAPAPTRSNPVGSAPKPTRARKPTDARAPRTAPKPDPTAKPVQESPQDSAATGRRPAGRATPVRATPRFTG